MFGLEKKINKQTKYDYTNIKHGNLIVLFNFFFRREKKIHMQRMSILLNNKKKN